MKRVLEDIFEGMHESLIVMTALAVIFSSLAVGLFVWDNTVKAATAVVVTNGQMNNFGPGAMVPASSPPMGVLKITLTGDTVGQTLTSVTANFGGTGFATTDLAALSADNASSGVALYSDNGNTVGEFDYDGSDSIIALVADPAPAWSSNSITLTPATPPAINNGSATIFHLVIRTSGTVENNDQVQITVPIGGVIASDTIGPASAFVGNYLRADTAPAAITEVQAFAGSSTLVVRFNKPVQKNGGGNIVIGDSPLTYSDGGGSVQTISAISHMAGQDFINVTLSGNLDAADVDGTPATIAAGENKIADMGGGVVGTGAVNLSSPVTITTPTIPTATVGTEYTTSSPLVSFGAQGGTAPYVFSAVAEQDTSLLTSAGLTITNDGGTYKLTGTVTDMPGSYPLYIKVTDSTGTPLEATRQFTLNIATSGGGVPGITNVAPPGGAQGASSFAVVVNGTNTSFSGSSTVQFLLNNANDTNITVSGVTAASTTSLSFNINIAADAATGNRDVRITTGSQVVIMPNGFQVFASGASGLTLLVPGENSTGVPMPPNFGFNPSTNVNVISYRVTLKTTSNFSGAALWDYAFPIPEDLQNSNGSHCTATSCNVGYGAGSFRIMTQPTPLAPNTTYYWQVRTYAEAVASVSDVATPLELTPVRGFTTVSSVTDVTPPSIMHRPLFLATAASDLVIFARVMDNIATTSTTPALATSLIYCNTAVDCTPATSVTGTYVGSGYFKYTIAGANVPAATGHIRYRLTATDGTNTANFTGSSNVPFMITTIAAGASTITGLVKDSTNTCAVGIQTATVFAEGTGFNTTTDGSCAYTLSGLTAGTYDVVAIKDGYADRMINGLPAGASSINFSLSQGMAGGFGGDTDKPRVKFSGPMDGMMNMPGNDSNFKIFFVFDKAMSASTITASNLTVNEVNISTGGLTDVTSKGTWVYYASAPVAGSMLPPEANLAAWSLSGSNTVGDNKTIAVKISANVTDTAGNSIQSNQPDGSYAITFTTGSTTNFIGYNNDTGAFADGGTFGAGAYTAPFVQGTTPPPGTYDAPRNTQITINFSEPMADDGGGYILGSYIKLYTVTNNVETDISTSAINTVTLDSSKRNASVALLNTYNSGTLAASTSYRLKVLGGVKAATNITLAPPNQAATAMFVADFKSGTTSDTTAPTIIGSYPDNAATNVPVNIGAINVGFSKDMSASTITTSTFYLSVGSTSVNGTVDYDAIGRQAFFMPQSALTPNTTYTINLTAGIQGLNGQAIAAATRTFTTGSADSAAPNVTFINADDYNLAITFSEPMNASKVTDTLNYTGSVLKPGNYALAYGNTGFESGTVITIPTTASFTYDPVTNTISIQGYHDGSITTAMLAGKEILVTVTGVKDLSGNTMVTGNTGRAPIQDSAATKGMLGPGDFAGDSFSQQGAFMSTNFSGDTFGFAPPVEVRPFNMMAGQTTIYGVRLPISSQIPAGGQVVLTFPTGFDVSGAKQDVNSPMRTDFNGPGTGAPTFKCQTATGGTSCGGGATVTGDTADDTTTKGGLADDGVIVNTSARTITIYLSLATNTEGHDFIQIDIAGIRNSTVPKDFNTTGYTVDVKTKDTAGTTVVESLTSQPFFIQGLVGEAYTLTGTITAADATTGTMKVYIGSPMTGQMEVTSTTFDAGSATYTFTNLQAGDYMLFTDQSITLGATDYSGKTMPERVVVNETADTANAGADDNSIPYNITIANASTGGTNVTINIDGPSNEALDIFAGSPTGFKAKQVTLDASAGAQAFTINLADGQWFVGVGPQMPKGMSAGPPPTPNYLPPKPKEVTVTNPTCAVDGTVGCSATFTLATASKQIKGLVKDGANKVMANAEVYAYSPNGGFGTHAQSDTTGAFTLGVTDGSYVVGAFVPGMPSSKEVPVTVTSNATTYLLIDGATTAVTPATAATAFILKVAKPDYTISGKVTDGTNVVQGASVYAYRTDGPGHANAITDNAGAYTLYVSNGTWHVGTFLPQYGQLTELTVVINSASASNQNFSPTQTGTFYTVSGRVYRDLNSNSTYNANEEISGAFVRLNGNGTFNEAITSVDGTYSFKVPGGNGYLIKAFAPNIGELPPLASFNVTGDVTDKDVVVSTPRTVTFTFSTSVTEAYVDLFSSTGVGNHTRIANSTTGTLQVPNGNYNVSVNIPGMAIGLTDIAGTDENTIYSSTTGIIVVDGSEGLTVTLPTLRTVTGTVTDGTNNIADAWVEIFSPTGGVHTGSRTATNGSFSINVSDGSYQINAMKPGYFREPSALIVNAETGAQTLTLATSSTTIGGQVLIGSTGAANAFVRAEKQGGGFAGTQADANGNYTLYVNSGVWHVYAVAEGYAEAAYAQNPIDVTGGSVSSKNITLTSTISLAAPKTKPITPASGGTVEDTTAGVKLTIPANALGSSTSAGNVEAKETTNVRETASSQVVNSYDSTSETYVNAATDIKATDSSGTPINSLNDDVTVELTYTKDELANSSSSTDTSINTKAEADTLKMGYWDETTANWVTLPSTVTYKDADGAIITDSTTIDTADEFNTNVATVTISAPTSHFSLYAPVVATDALAPSTPSGLAKTTSSSASITMEWTQVSGATGYDIYRSATSGGTFSRLGSEPTVSSGSTVTYVDSGLSASTTYYYKITALNGAGESAASSEVAMETSAAGGGGGSGGGSPAPVVEQQPVVTPAEQTIETPQITEQPQATETTQETTISDSSASTTRAAEVATINAEATQVLSGTTQEIAEAVGKSRDVGLETRYDSSIVARVVVTNTPAATRAKVLSFVTYGTTTTQALGAGERGGVVNSFKDAFGKLPATEADWQDVLKIANGRWPSTLRTTREAQVENTFKKIYLRNAIRTNAHDDAAITVMAYGLRSANRNLNSEKVAINTFKAIFKKAPSTASDWDAVRAIAYSGAKR